MSLYLDKFSSYLDGRKSPATARNYLNTVVRYFVWLKQREPNPENAEEFLAFLNLHEINSRSLNRHLSAIKCFFKSVLKKELMIESFRFEKKLPMWLTEDEQHKYVAACENVYETAVVTLLLGSGMRVSEAAGLTTGCIKPDGKIKVMGKGGKERIIAVQQVVIENIQLYLNSRKFQSRIVFPRGSKSIQRVVKEVAIRAGLGKKITPHSLRHSFGSLWVKKGGKLEQLRDELGHANIATTSIYTHTTVEEIQHDMPDLLEDNKV